MANNAPTAYRCTVDDANWPMVPLYRTCPICGERTWPVKGEEPLSSAEAQELITAHREAKKRLEEFERYYAEREVKRLRVELDEFVGV